MIAGLPGTGIGGIFYLLLAVWMPVRESYLSLRKRAANRWKMVGQHVLLTIGIILGIWATGFVLGLILVPLLTPSINASPLSINYLRIAPFILTLGVLVFVQLLLLLLRAGVGLSRMQAKAQERRLPQAITSRARRSCAAKTEKPINSPVP
jgi:ribose/xylose/arabinose/galactoside ABC-type transport system permease subunit